MDPHRSVALQAGAGRPVQDLVAVVATGGYETCMEGVGHLLRPADAHIHRQVDVAAEHPGAHRTPGIGVEVDDLLQRMDAGIGTPGAMHGQPLVRHLGDGLLHTALDAPYAGLLALPAMETGAVVFHAHCDTHRFSLAMSTLDVGVESKFANSPF